MDGTAAPVEAILVVDGTIAATGAFAEVAAQVTGDVAVIDLDGAAVIPGFVDAHIHTGGFARENDAVDLRGVTGLDEALERIRTFAATRAPGAWVIGGRWDSNTWDVPVQPDRHSLDRISPDRPVALPSIDGHTIWANTLALKAAGLSASTPDPIGGEIVRDEQGEPTGILRESARYPVRDLMYSPLAGDLVAQLRVAQQQLLSVGITSVHDLDGEDVRAAYLELHETGELDIRVHKSIPMEYLDQAIAEGRRTGEGDEWFTTGPVKIFSDGALGSHTSHMGEDFAGEEGNHGMEVVPYDELQRMVGAAIGAGIAVATHAIGDQANHLVLNAYEAHLPMTREKGLRHRIEHAQHIRRSDIPRFAQLGVIPSLQPTHCTSDIQLADALLAGRDLGNYAWRSLTTAGARLAFGSDAPVEEPDPFYGIHAAVTRQDASGNPAGGWEPEERLGVGEAIEAYTTGGAFAAGISDVGRLTVGSRADFIVVDDDPFTTAPENLRHISVLAAIVGGKVRYRR
jgi:predicted amidohydrolase YtcJ